ncbi:hypothetical protein [Bifidobacterium callimiconis]|uniref:Uncharacterized protein n=1 Tax=Bifidobacterium callimiconis TaxID=2306973 RepID=A0A430FCR4_9BIFI|nr:hypothetical protein [Bifidobacterium callimiconis]MBT1176726.1 hypothetical protein [Bifidobacterium callimiconis]RSX50627.1 hypothetical protein D2E23_1292 [Bifidobacterium callimiconis]
MAAMHDTAMMTVDAPAASTTEPADDRLDVSSEFPRLSGLDERSFDDQIAAYRSVLDQLKAELDGLRIES